MDDDWGYPYFRKPPCCYLGRMNLQRFLAEITHFQGMELTWTPRPHRKKNGIQQHVFAVYQPNVDILLEISPMNVKINGSLVSEVITSIPAPFLVTKLPSVVEILFSCWWKTPIFQQYFSGLPSDRQTMSMEKIRQIHRWSSQQKRPSYGTSCPPPWLVPAPSKRSRTHARREPLPALDILGFSWIAVDVLEKTMGKKKTLVLVVLSGAPIHGSTPQSSSISMWCCVTMNHHFGDCGNPYIKAIDIYIYIYW